MSERIEARLQELRSMADEFAKAYADRSHLEEMKKSKLAILMKQAEVEGHKTTAAQEREARAHSEYIALLEGLKVATENSERLRWQLEVSKLGVGVWQTMRADERAERRAYGA
jgi:hypothetical protein